MSNKMLIDASHPEETRVAVVRGNRIEEYDFESQEKKQLRGNIYLAKVTRVEPSLQAAFVDYGGNRHGFLAFSEIHPDYYQIPVADRQALLEAEAADARAARDADDEDQEQDDDALDVASHDSEDDEDEAPKKKTRRRRSRKSKQTSDETADTQTDSETDTSDAVSPNDDELAAKTNDDTVAEENTLQEEEVEKPKRRSTRRKKAPVTKKVVADETPSETDADKPVEAEASEDTKPVEEEKPKRRSTRRKKAPIKKADAETSEIDDGADEDGKPTTMSAIVETDSISEPLPEDADEPEDTSDSEESQEEQEAEAKPKRRSTRRKKAPVKAKTDEDISEEASNDSGEDAKAEETNPQEDSAAESVDQEVSEEQEDAPKKKKRAPRRSRKKKVEASEDTTEDPENSDSDEGIELVGQEDALEEVPTPRRQRRHYKIQEVIKRRQVLLVQVVKEERGNKGAALTTYLSLAGRYSVLMPNTARGGGISRKITNASDRKRLKAIANGLEVPNGMGVILRTAGASRTNVEIERDFDYLMRLWEQVRNLTLSSSAPCLVYEEGSLIKRSIRDLYDKDTNEVVVAGENGFSEAKDFMNMLMPSASNKVKLHRDKQSIFAKFGVETQLDKMVTPQVTLKSGGYLIIDQTEALVSVDVNSGRSTREHSIENTALQTNLEAAEEVARQLRLRDLAGLIVIDFIDMEEKRNNRAVEKKIKDCLKNDRARIQVGRISHFGLLEMSRQRMRASVLESTMDVCSHCGGTGHVRSDSAISLHVFRAIEEHVSRHNRYDAVVKTTPSIAMHILNYKRAALLDLENRYGLAIIIEGTNDIKGQEFDIQKGEIATGEVKSSAVGFQNTSIDTDDVSDDDENSNKGRKRGRGNRKNRNDEAEADSENNEEAEVTSNDDDDDKPRKKRRRGKRGGRSRNSTEKGDEAEEATSESVEATDKSQPEVEASSDVKSNAQAEPETANENVVTEEKPKSRSTTRRKAPISKPAVESEASQPASNNASDTNNSDEEPPRPKRRTTRRKKVSETDKPDEVEASGSLSSSEENAHQEVANTPSAETPKSDGDQEPSDEPAKEEIKKKSGWWNRGGSFF